MTKRHLSAWNILCQCDALVERERLNASSRLYGVPRGGVPVALALAGLAKCELVDDPNKATHIIDDIIASGATKKAYDKYGLPFIALIEKSNPGEWIVFPWETSPQGDESVTDNIRRLLQFIGEDPTRDGLKDTPRRVARYWEDVTAGAKLKPADIMKVFEDGAEAVDQMVFQGNIPFFSHCEHHLVPFFGVAHMAYIPAPETKRILGLSKFARLLDIFARRLQVQERITTQVVEALMENLQPLGAACTIRARHLCMECRGVQKIGAITMTSKLSGAFLDNSDARAEFMQFIAMSENRATSL